MEDFSQQEQKLGDSVHVFDPDVCVVSFFSDGILERGVDTIYESPFPSLWQSRVDATNHLTKLKEESCVDWIWHAMHPGPDVVFF